MRVLKALISYRSINERRKLMHLIA